MSVKVGLNGFGRIGRYMARLLAGDEKLQLAAINARSDNETLAHLLKYDSVHGKFQGTVSTNDNGLVLNGSTVPVTRQEPGDWLWGELGVDIVLETTGKFRDRESCEKHLDCGARKVLISAPGKQPDATIVVGVNDSELKPEHRIVSNASCTTNCLAPVTKVLHDSFGIERGLMTTVHSYTMDQRILDGSHKDLRRARAAGMSIVPTTTGAARAVTEVIPDLKGKLDGLAMRVPTPNVSLIDLTADLASEVTREDVNRAMKDASEGSLRSILGYSEEPLVSVDYVSNEYAGVVDSLITYVIDSRTAKVIAWYDNEAGFSHQLLRLTEQAAAHV
jgi:glyceraldehyde 3-phosphate dehydrogenase